jgi:hypothetical protein
MTSGLKNIPLRLFRDYLYFKGLKPIREKGGHEVWSRKNLLRPIILQSHIDPIPEFIIRSNLRTLGETADDFYEFVKNK